MKAHTGGLMAYLNPNTQQQASQIGASVPEQDNIVWIDARDLVRNDRNFYGIRAIEELAALIAASGVVDPLTVTPTEDGKYRIVSGERRTAATLLRLERGDLIDPKVPCIVRSFSAHGALTAEDNEMLCLIASNLGQRQTRTPLEKLREIEELEPIVKKIFKDEQIKGTFRRFFAEQMRISQSKLQRLKTLVNLVEEGRQALDLGLLSETAAEDLARHSEEDQRAFVESLVKDGSSKGRVEDVKAFFAPTENQDGQVEPEASASTLENGASEINEGQSLNGSDDSESDYEDSDNNNDDEEDEEENENDDDDDKDQEVESKNKTIKQSPSVSSSNRIDTKPRSFTSQGFINVDIPFPEDLSGDKAEREADTWIESFLTDAIEFAKAKIDESRAAGDTRTAALWDSRRAKAVLTLETVRD